MNEGVISSTALNPPDWSTIHREILCPLCDYNLRGLVEPRCPGCGFRATWDELLEVDAKNPPWLFEHRQKRHIRGFVCTLYNSQFPRWFWREVKPNNPPNLRKLLIYWFIVGAIICAMVGPSFATLGNLYWSVHEARATLASDAKRLTRFRRAYPNLPVEKIAVEAYPYPSPLAVLIYGWDQSARVARIDWSAALMFLLWPWLTSLSLLVFAETIWKTRKKPSHIIRTAVYAADVGILVMLPATGAISFLLGIYGPKLPAAEFLTPGVVAVVLLVQACLTARLYIACRDYLRFPQPLATCLLSQVIVSLASIAIFILVMT